MDREGYADDTKFFIGTEVEHSPAYGQRTLFVIGLQNPKEILARALNNNCPHIYLGANMSYDPQDTAEYQDWDYLLLKLISGGAWVTLDYDVKHHENVLEGGMTEYDNFIPMISIKMPYIKQLNYNACIKIDDKDFQATNPGVWVHRVHDMLDREVFTDWSKYTKDEIIQ